MYYFGVYWGKNVTSAQMLDGGGLYQEQEQCSVSE